MSLGSGVSFRCQTSPVTASSACPVTDQACTSNPTNVRSFLTEASRNCGSTGQPKACPATHAHLRARPQPPHTNTAAGVYVKSGATDNIVGNNQLMDNNRMSVVTSSPSSDDSGAFGVLLRGDRTEVAGNLITGSDAFSYDYGRDGAAVEVY